MPRKSRCSPVRWRAVNQVWVWLLVGWSSLMLSGCSTSLSYQRPVSPECVGINPPGAQEDFPLREHLPLPVEVLEDRMRSEPFTVLAASSIGGGSTTSAMQLTIQFEDCLVTRTKWRAASPSGQAYNNNPRKEIAAYEIQKLFLETKDYVVPVTVLTCIPKTQLDTMGAPGVPQIDGSDCVFGTLAIWLRNVAAPNRVMNQERFAASIDAGEGGYAWHAANLNLLTYLIKHLDGRATNFLISTHPASQRLFSIDNGLAFGGLGNPRRLFDPFLLHLHRLQVDKLPRETVERLRQLSRDQLYSQLETVAEIRLGGRGKARSFERFSPTLDPAKGLRRRPGVVQLGLKRQEIAAVARRLRHLLNRVAEREIQLF